MSEHEGWLNLTIEEPIDPGLPICDPHHHLWRHTTDSYLLRDFLSDISGGHNIVQTVFVEAWPLYQIFGPQEMKPVEETEFVITERTNTESRTDVAAGIVGYADLTLGSAVAPVLESHMAASKNRFRGIRYITAWDASPIFKRPPNPKGLLFDSKFREGFATLHRYGLNYDAFLYHHQLMELMDLAKAFPDTPIILNHIGSPLGIGPYYQKREEVFQEWKRGIAALANCQNVFIKLGGFGMDIFGFGWHERATPPNSAEVTNAIAPYCHFCIEKFGVERCMFESNFPIDKESFSYTILWNAFKRILKDFSYGERCALFHDTAMKVYHLRQPD